MGKDVIIACDFDSAEKTFAFLDTFLRYHAEETAEEILYNTVIAASEQSSGTVQPESGDAGEGGHADDDI